MGGPIPFESPGGLSWNPAPVELPPIPMIPPGQDAMSMTISAVIPTLTTPLTASVTALAAKETMFSGKVVDAESAYKNADDSGGQSVGQLSSMIGQVGQMAQQAAGAGGTAGGGSAMFGSLMEQAMKAAQSFGGSEAGGSGDPAGAGGQSGAGMSPAAAPMGGPGGQPSGAGTPHQRDEAADPSQEQPREYDDRERQPEEPAERPPVEASGPGDRQRDAGPAQVAPPERPRHGDDDLARRM